jgi:uncharacterized membrane protein (DUF485 family)
MELRMTANHISHIRHEPLFQELVRKRTRFAWILSAAMLVIYFGFIAIIAFAPNVLALPIGNGVTTVGIPVGLFVIISAFVLTGIYVRRANSEFDPITREIIEKVK